MLAVADAGRSPGEQDGATAARHHDTRRLAPHQEAGEAGHLPHLGEDARGGLANGEAHIGADIEHRDLDRADLALDLVDHGDGLVLLARIGAEGAGPAALLLDLPDQRFELVGVAARHAGDIALASEAAGDRPAGRVAGTDHQRDFLGHAPSPRGQF
jgi:hypothetical protein